MMIHCNECGHNGEAKTNSRGDVRCEACYSVKVVPLTPARADPADTPADMTAPGETAGDKPPEEVEIKPRPRKRTA